MSIASKKRNKIAKKWWIKVRVLTKKAAEEEEKEVATAGTCRCLDTSAKLVCPQLALISKVYQFFPTAVFLLLASTLCGRSWALFVWANCLLLFCVRFFFFAFIKRNVSNCCWAVDFSLLINPLVSLTFYASSLSFSPRSCALKYLSFS